MDRRQERLLEEEESWKNLWVEIGSVCPEDGSQWTLCALGRIWGKSVCGTGGEKEPEGRPRGRIGGGDLGIVAGSGSVHPALALALKSIIPCLPFSPPPPHRLSLRAQPQPLPVLVDPRCPGHPPRRPDPTPPVGGQSVATTIWGARPTFTLFL